MSTAITDANGVTRQVGEALAPIIDRVYERACALGLTRVRGGMARGNWWAELAGRPTVVQGMHAGWVEIRLHHRPDQSLVQAGALIYDPLSKGGRTRVLGQASHTYRSSPEESIAPIGAMLDVVLGTLEDGRGDD